MARRAERWSPCKPALRTRVALCAEAAVVRRCGSESWPGEDGRCPARTGDLLLVRRKHLPRSTGACRSDRTTSGGSLVAAAFCCGFPLPKRFQVSASTFGNSLPFHAKAAASSRWLGRPLDRLGCPGRLSSARVRSG